MVRHGGGRCGARADRRPVVRTAAGAPAPERIALVNANVVNVVTGTVQDGQTLVLSGGRIESIGAAPPPSGARVSTSATAG